METLTMRPGWTLDRRILAPVTSLPTGGGGQVRRRRGGRVASAFTLRDAHRAIADAEYLASFAAVHQGDTPFWFDGGPWGTPSTPLLVGVGNGVQTHFWLPNRWLLDPPLVYADGVLLATQPDAELTTGQLRFASAPALNVVLTAGYTCRYPVVFGVEAQTLLTEQYFYHLLFAVEGLVLQEVHVDAAPVLVTDLYAVEWEYDPFAGLVEYYTTIFDY